MRRFSRQHSSRQKGVALVLLLILLAGLTLLVTGVTGHARVDTRLTQALVQRAEAGALMNGYAHMVLRDLALARNEARIPAVGPFSRSYRDGDRRIDAVVFPASAFLDPGTAGVELTAYALQYVGGLHAEAAEQLAERIVTFGAEDPESGVPTAILKRFVVIEDLLRVPGIHRDVYEKMAPVLRVGGAALPSPLVARDELLLALAEGDPATVADWRRQMDDRAAGVQPAGWGSMDYEIMMSTSFADGKRYTRRISAQPAPGGAVPYTFRRMHPVLASGSVSRD